MCEDCLSKKWMTLFCSREHSQIEYNRALFVATCFSVKTIVILGELQEFKINTGRCFH